MDIYIFPWIFIGRTDAEAEAPIFCPPDVKSQLIGKVPDARKDWVQEEKGVTEDEMVGWHHWLYGHEFEQAPGVGDGQGSLVCCSSWCCKELDTTEQLNWLKLEKYSTYMCKAYYPFLKSVWILGPLPITSKPPGVPLLYFRVHWSRF